MKDSNLPDDLKEVLEQHKESNDEVNKSYPSDSEHSAKTHAEQLEEKKQKISEFASKVVFGSINDAKCKEHRKYEHDSVDVLTCPKCQTIKERVESSNRHGCTFSCQKKKKLNILWAI